MAYSQILKLTSDEDHIFSCWYCDFKTRLSETRDFHYLTVHISQVSVYSCPYLIDECEFQNIMPHEVVKHLMDIHIKPLGETVGNYRCNMDCLFCNFKSHAESGPMDIHLTTHLVKGTLYNCPQCQFSSILIKQVFLHMTNIHFLKTKQELFEKFEIDDSCLKSKHIGLEKRRNHFRNDCENQSEKINVDKSSSFQTELGLTHEANYTNLFLNEDVKNMQFQTALLTVTGSNLPKESNGILESADSKAINGHRKRHPQKIVRHYNTRFHIKCKMCDPIVDETNSSKSLRIKDLKSLTFDYKKLNKPKRIISYSCVLCGKSFSRKFSLRFHLKLHQKGKDRLLVKTTCSTLKIINKVNKTSKNIKALCNVKVQTSLNKKQYLSNAAISYLCVQCGKLFPKKTALWLHLMVHTQGNCNIIAKNMIDKINLIDFILNDSLLRLVKRKDH
ncbi:zinc finger protein 585A-like [Physella acuta]|uniref:zinc finger protein 585A-like n=1 Tax=Physella acuta TaxID=109671 RepID=UPI0027DD0627|nr:zinc finger protein 585A-like [Physella acuta]